MRWLIGGMLVALAATASANDVGEIKKVSGTVHLEREGKRLPVQAGAAVRQSDVLVTGADGSVGITFADNSLLSAGPDSVLAIDHYTFNPTTHAGKFDASLRRGSLAVISGRMVKASPDAMHVRTPSSIMGVRGTEFIVEANEL